MQNDPIARKIVHIEMIQSTIVRMADNGATMKRYAIVTFALGSAMARYLNVPEVLAVVAGVVVVFWYLDSKYLQQEKWYRDWYDVVRQGPSEYNHFQMTLDSNFKARTTMWYGLKSWSTLPLYVSLLAISCILWWYFLTTPPLVKDCINEAKSILQLSLQA